MAESQAKVKISADAAGLKPAEDAVNKLGKAAENVGAAAAGTAAELRQVGQVGTGAGNDVARAAERATESSTQAAQAARQEAQAIDEVSAAARQEADAVEAAGRAAVQANEKAEQSVDELANAMRAVATAIRASDEPLALQQQSLIAYEERLEAIASGYRANTEASRLHADAATAALADVRKQAEAVGAEIRKIETEKAFRRLADDVVQVDDAFESAVSAIARVQKEIAETGRVGARSIGQAAQAVENYRITVAESGDAIDGARREEVARLEQLEAHLVRVTQRANALTNAAKDNAVRLKETGAQVGAIGLAVQDLTRFLGPNAQAFGNVAAQIGLVGVNVEQAKDAFGGLNLNQIGAARGAVGLGAQLAAVLAVMIASSKAGLELAKTDQDVADVMDGVSKTAKDLGRTLGVFLKNEADRFGASMKALREILLSGFGASEDQFRALSLAIREGSDAVNAYYDLRRRGVVDEEAARLAIIESQVALKAQTEEVNNASSAQDKHATSHRNATAATEAHTAAVQRYQTAESLALEAVSKVGVELVLLEKAVNGTTPAISTAAHVIAEMADASDRNSVALAAEASALEAAAAKADNMSRAERDRVTEVVELARRGGELNVVEQARLETLARELESSKGVTAATSDLANATDALLSSVRATTAGILEATGAQDSLSESRRMEIAVLNELIARAEAQKTQEEEAALAARYHGDSLEFLRAKREQLIREQGPQLTVWHATEQAQSAVADEAQRQADATRSQITANTDLEAINRRVKDSEDLLKSSMTNLTDEQRKSIAAAAEAANATGKITPNADGAAAAMRALQAPFAQLPGNARELAAALPEVDQHIRSIADNASRAADNIARMNRAVADGASTAAGAAQ